MSAKVRILIYLMLIFAFLAVAVVSLLVNRPPPSPIRAESRGGPYGLSIYRDQETGCAYIANSWVGVTPRLRSDGAPDCTPPRPENPPPGR